jgi:hypothetical protein
MKIRQLITFAISIILLAGVVSANAAQPLQIDRSTRPAEPSFGFSITDDNFSGYGSYSSIHGAKVGGFTTNVECTSVSDLKCAQAENLRVSVIVPPCPAIYDATDVCIKSLKTADSTGTLQNATLQYEAETNKFPKDTKYQLPAGGGGSVWRGASSKGGTLDYAVVVDLQIMWYRNAQPGLPDAHKSVVGYSAQVIPVKVKTGNYYPIYWKYNQPSGFITSEPQLPAGVTTYDPWFDCVIVDKGRCAMADIFYADQKIELSLQMDNTVTGWMFGRMKDTKVSAIPLSKNSSLLTVEGASINVPFGHAWVPLKAVPTGTPSLQEFARLQKILGNDITSEYFNWGRPSNHSDLFQFPTTGLFGGEIFKPSAAVAGVGMFSGIEPWLKTISTTPTWRFQGMSPSSFWGMDQSSANKVWGCTVNDKTKLHGLMTTNAMAYSWSPPALKDGFLSYKVAGAHLDSDGSVYKGTYNLSMNADSAKCIYGFTDAPIQATVSITKEGGETTNIATELLSIKNGWMNLSANNFTFSDPTIRIKLTQEATVAKPTPAATPTPTVAAPVKVSPKKITITCAKGSVKKVVTGTKPACPAGFKKK